MAGCEGTAAHEAHEAGQGCISNFNLVAEDGVAGRIGDAEELPNSWTHDSSPLDLALPALN